MPRHRVLAHAAVALLLALSGCTTDDGSATGRGNGDAGPETPAEPTSEAQPAGEAEPQDPLAAEPADQVPGGVDHVVRAGDGSTLVVLTSDYRDVSHFRVYDRAWRPTTPPLQVQVRLEEVRGTPRGFLALASRTRRSGRSSYREWVALDRRGRLRVERPSQAPRPPWRTRRTAWYPQPDGSVCAYEHRGRPGDPVRSSLDGGRTWQVTDTSGLPADAGPRLWMCATAGDRVVVLTGGSEYPRMLHTFDRDGGALLANLTVGDDTPVDPYAWWLLPDGSLVARSDRPGVVVATDSTNAAVAYRGGPVGAFPLVAVLDDQIVQARADRRLAVSEDRGVTWRLVDLALPTRS